MGIESDTQRYEDTFYDEPCNSRCLDGKHIHCVFCGDVIPIEDYNRHLIGVHLYGIEGRTRNVRIG